MPATLHAPAAPVAASPCRGGRRSRVSAVSSAPSVSSVSSEGACLRARFRAGDETALDEVYRRYSAQLMVIGVRRLGDRDLAAEAIQQAFVQAWRAAGAYDPTRALAPWLYAIMRRVCVDLFRRERRVPDLFDDGAVPDRTTAPAAAEVFERAWEAAAVRRAVDALPKLERDVVRLTYLHDLTFAQAADRLAVPVGTVKSRSHRAHRRLAEVLTANAELFSGVA